jgi:DUF2975 family protein
MKELKMKTPLSIKLIYWIVNFAFWIVIIGIVAIIVEHIFFFFNPDSYHFSKFELPLNLDLLSISEVNMNGKITSVKISKIYGIFNIWDLNTQAAIVFYISVFLNGTLFIYALQVIKKILINVKSNSVFTFVNVGYLKNASFIFFFIWIVRDIILHSYMQVKYGYFNPFNNFFMDYLLSTYLLIATILLAIAYIFEHGVKLQNYKDLTI